MAECDSIYTFVLRRYRNSGGVFNVPVEDVGRNFEKVYFIIIDTATGRSVLKKRNASAVKDGNHYTISYDDPKPDDILRLEAFVNDDELKKSKDCGDYGFLKSDQAYFDIT